ncbi:MAG: glutathione S-transferase family protein [Pseudomonadales bacterium]|nr:glutathione S-transferase family protein [Pseudomonadales bacterium]RZV56348.1 MAG: glutathione S-transferase family protein [Pseudomonadales bacterium]
MSIKIYGASISPYVRKVRMALAVRELDYELIPVIPGGEDQPAEFKANSPLGKIPLAHIDDIFIPDSSVILAYLERARSQNPLLSEDAKLAAKALWYEEYADSQMVSVIAGHLFAEMILAPAFFQRESNQEEIDLAKNEEIPAIFDYLESELQANFLIGDSIGHADVCVGSPFVTMHHCGVQCDASRWPKTAAYIERVTGQAAFAKIIQEEKEMLAAFGVQ